MLKVILFFLAIAGYATEDIAGFWKTVNEQGEAQCIFAIYEYDDVYYGRIIGIYDDKGVMDDTIYKPRRRAPGVAGNPFYCGLDIIWGLIDVGVKFKGKILDPEKGNVYNSELWTEDGNLIVRGKYLIFGRNQTWYAAQDTDFPKDFKKPDLTKIEPNVPEVN